MSTSYETNASAGPGGPVESLTTIAIHPVAWYSQPPRPGFQVDFLGQEVALPTLPAALAQDVVALSDGSSELRYMHYSVVMSASRKLAWFSAANIDGATSVSLSRTDRDPGHPETADFAEPLAADAWWFDGRIRATGQTGATIYDGTDFDFGHLTRRLDPVWGDPASARVANDDTFHMTNCAPQAHALNTGTWAQLEDAVLAAARDHKLKFVVITGPVLAAADPVIKDVQIPLSFWKVFGFLDDAALTVMGFLQSQADLVAKVGQGAHLTELDKAEQWHVPISEIASLTGLGFGSLEVADIKAGGAAEALTTELVTHLATRFFPPSVS